MKHRAYERLQTRYQTQFIPTDLPEDFVRRSRPRGGKLISGSPVPDEARLKMQRDEQARLEHAREQGLAEGEARGELIGQIRLLQQLLGIPESSPDLLRQQSLEELAAMAGDLQRQLRERH